MMQSKTQLRPRIAAVILAAGKSSRLKRPKQLVPFRGLTLIRRVVLTAIFSQCEWVLVVIGAFHLRVRRELKFLDCDVVRNSFWHLGMGGSVKAGVEYSLKKYPDIDGFLFLVCDQPFLSEDYLDQMIAAFNEGHRIVASQFAETFGVPALIGVEYANELMNIDDKRGAKQFLESHQSSLKLLEFNGGEFDIDTPSDVEALRRVDMAPVATSPPR